MQFLIINKVVDKKDYSYITFYLYNNTKLISVRKSAIFQNLKLNYYHTLIEKKVFENYAQISFTDFNLKIITKSNKLHLYNNIYKYNFSTIKFDNFKEYIEKSVYYKLNFDNNNHKIEMIISNVNYKDSKNYQIITPINEINCNNNLRNCSIFQKESSIKEIHLSIINLFRPNLDNNTKHETLTICLTNKNLPYFCNLKFYTFKFTKIFDFINLTIPNNIILQVHKINFINFRQKVLVFILVH